MEKEFRTLGETIKKYKSLVDYLRYLDSKNNSNSYAIEYFSNRITREKYWKYIDKYRLYFKNIGICKGEAVAICMLNSPEYEFVFLSLIENGSIASTVSKSFLNADLNKQTTEKNIKTLILSVEFLPDLIKMNTFKQINKDSTLCRIILTRAYEYSGQNDTTYYEELIKSIDLPNNIEIIYPGEMAKLVSEIENDVLENENLLDDIATYSNTGGTTGAPKCAYHTHKAIMSLIISHDKENFPEFNLKEHSRSLIVIPVSHITSQFYALLLHRAYGATIIYNPHAFDPNVLRDILITQKIDDVVLPFGLYYAITRERFNKGELLLNTALCGGEPTPYMPTKDVNEKLNLAGSSSLVIGTGSTEFGSGIMGSYGIKNRVNESGYFFPYADGFILNPKNSEKIKEINKRGILYAYAPWQMSGYLNDSKATNEFFSYSEKGKTYGTNYDIAEIVGEHNGKQVFSLLGRITDFVLPNEDGTYQIGLTMNNGKVANVDLEKGYFLFDIRDILLNISGVMEVQPILLPSENDENIGYPVVNVIIEKSINPQNMLKQIYAQFKNKKFKPAGIIFRTHFERSLSTDKREVISLFDEREGYYFIDENDNIMTVDFPKGKSPCYKLLKKQIEITNPPQPKQVYSEIK